MVNEIGNPQGDILDLLVNAKLGDGGIYTCSVNYYVAMFSKNLDYLEYKHKLLKPYQPSDITSNASGYKKGSNSYKFQTRVHEDITKISETSIIDCIKLLSRKGLCMLYLDDGSYHQKKHFMHIYCNSFSIEEVESLADKIFEYYPVKRPTLRWDKKRDGRKFPYLYIPVSTTKAFKEDVTNFIEENEVYSMYYKVGKNIPSTTNETDLKRIG